MLINLKGKERIEPLNKLATDLRESDQDLAMKYSFEADSLATVFNDLSARSRALENIGWIYYRKGNWQKSFEYSKKAYEFALDSKDKLQAARLMNNMGALYYEQKNHPKSIEQFRKGYLLATEVDDLYTRIRSLNNMALNFSQSGQQDSALYYANLSIRLNKEAGSPYLTSFAHRVVGDVFLAKGQYDTAQVIFQKSLEMARNQGVKSFEAGILHRLGHAYFLDNKLDKAKEILEYSVDFCLKNQYLDELSSSYKYLYQVYEKEGNLQKAFFNQSQYLLYYDSLVNKSNRDRLALVQGMFEEDLASSELELLKAQNENQSLRLATSRRYTLFFAIAAVLIAALGIWMYLLNRNMRKVNRDLSAQQKKIADQNQELEQQSEQLKSINETKNKLFSILGHDLRGPVGQIKSVVDLMLQDQLEKEEFFELLNYLKKDIDSVNFTLNNTLKWSMAQMEGFELNPLNFNLFEVVKNSLDLLQASIKEKDLVVFNQLRSETLAFGDPDLVEVVVRNLINNAVKFSNPGDAITIYAEKNKDFLELYILDQGIGMSQEQIDEILSEQYMLSKSKLGTNKEKGSGLGLQLVKDFVKMNRGKIEIDSHPGHGTKFCVKLPLLV
ncbi:tetratricopeptide repeat-containing sensor histidine kinase [Algoriphagus mannitolivorans]|uniref:tetratricopeptide repeat-containing sensor histidine kinase n=1 Tax=Algoriphagus mannitolivorans TaxID=226504 RepID=UPI001B7F8836|nr:tetratricopeptide repeat-containing sensor histidine kinase [Algoriphagus mannitolivorans]